MHPMPPEYKAAMQAGTREIDVYLAVGVNIDQTAADDITSITSTNLPMSNRDQLTDAIYEIEPGLATFEAYGIPSAPSSGMIAPPIQATAYPPEVALWSDVISDADGNIDWSFSIELSKAHTSALTVFTREVGIIEADITFLNGSTVTASGPMTPFTDSIQYEAAVTYTKVTVHVTKLEAPFRHVRVVEIEFGASKTYSKNTLTGTVSIIQERDPTMQAIPLHELDFTLINVLGEWDIDNPLGGFGNVKIGYPVVVGFTCRTDVGQYTVPIGRFIVSEKKGSDTELTVTCYDPRKVLQDIYMPWSITTTENLGTALTDLFTDAHIPHIIESGVFDIVPDRDITFSDEQSLLEAMRHIEQYYNVWLVPERDGFIHARVGPTTGDYGDMSMDMMYTFPTAHSFTRYNFIQVAYGSEDQQEHFNLDLRTSTDEAKSQISVSNPLVLTQDKAMEVANRIRQSLYTQMTETEWRTDLLNDIGDLMGLCGKWTQNTPTDYRCIYNEITYDGGLRAVIRTTI